MEVNPQVKESVDASVVSATLGSSASVVINNIGTTRNKL